MLTGYAFIGVGDPSTVQPHDSDSPPAPAALPLLAGLAFCHNYVGPGQTLCMLLERYAITHSGATARAGLDLCIYE